MAAEEGDQDPPALELQNTDESSGNREPRKCCDFTPQTRLCISHAFSAWGDRMWEFAVALYLVELTPGSLRLTAIFQLVRTLCVIFLGPFVGNWVDANSRLRVAQLSLVVQNLAVAVAALVLLLILSTNMSTGLFYVMVTLVIVISCLAVLAGIATKIAIEKDWVVVICGVNKAVLAGTNAVMRRIDLVCKLLAPALVGQIMTYVSKSAGVILIASWNVCSVFLEYYLLWRVFNSVPALAHKKIDKKRHGEQIESTGIGTENEQESQGSVDRLNWMEGSEEGADTEALVPQTDVKRTKTVQKPGIIQRLKNKATTLRIGWRIYMRQSVARPGVSLACLYFTVLSFGSITTAYMYTQHMTESILSILRGVGSLFGVLATFAFPKLRNSIGVVRTGLFSMSAQFFCILFCFFGVFAPGSPFFILPDSWRYHVLEHGSTHNSSFGNCTFPPMTPSVNVSSVGVGITTSFPVFYAAPSSTYMTYSTRSLPMVTPNVLSAYSTRIPTLSTVVMTATHNARSPSTHISPSRSVVKPSTSRPAAQHNCSHTTEDTKKKSYHFSYISVSMLLAGIIVSRFGLWLSDLVITQLQQESVPEEERGIVGAMQKSLNSILDMMMYIFVISLPKPEQFGIMALMSVAAVGLAGVLFSTFSYKVRGHLFHFEKVKGFCVSGPPGSQRIPGSQQVPGSPVSQRRGASSQDSLGMETDDEEETVIRGVLSTRNENFKY